MGNAQAENLFTEKNEYPPRIFSFLMQYLSPLLKSVSNGTWNFFASMQNPSIKQASIITAVRLFSSDIWNPESNRKSRIQDAINSRERGIFISMESSTCIAVLNLHLIRFKKIGSKRYKLNNDAHDAINGIRTNRIPVSLLASWK